MHLTSLSGKESQCYLSIMLEDHKRLTTGQIDAAEPGVS